MTLENDISNLKRERENLNKDKQSAEKLRDANFENAQRGIKDIDAAIWKVTAHLQLYGAD